MDTADKYIKAGKTALFRPDIWKTVVTVNAHTENAKNDQAAFRLCVYRFSRCRRLVSLFLFFPLTWKTNLYVPCHIGTISLSKYPYITTLWWSYKVVIDCCWKHRSVGRLCPLSLYSQGHFIAFFLRFQDTAHLWNKSWKKGTEGKKH